MDGSLDYFIISRILHRYVSFVTRLRSYSKVVTFDDIASVNVRLGVRNIRDVEL
jgi:stage III sporulation protein SpoIIIAA